MYTYRRGHNDLCPLLTSLGLFVCVCVCDGWVYVGVGVYTYRRGYDDLSPLLTSLGLFPHTASSIRTHHIDVVHLTKLLSFMVDLQKNKNSNKTKK